MAGDPQDEYEKRYMDPGERVLFREKIVSQTAFRLSVAFAAIFGVAGLVGIVAGLAGVFPVGPGLAFGAPFAVLGAMFGVLGVMFSVVRVLVSDANVHVHFGWAKRKIPLSAIQSASAVQLRGFKQGKVSLGADGVVRTWTSHSSSGRGVEITYQEEGARKHIITIGSEDADRFAEMVNRARASTATPAVRVATEPEATEAVLEEPTEDAEASRDAR